LKNKNVYNNDYVNIYMNVYEIAEVPFETSA